MSSAQQKKLIIVFLGMGIFGMSIYMYTKGDAQAPIPVGAVHEVVLTQEGFTPPSLTVKKGDEVVFRSEKGVEFWPASNQHPIHADYPAFDPKMPIMPDASWSFQFTQVGTWAYHDHLNSPLRGEVIVIP